MKTLLDLTNPGDILVVREMQHVYDGTIGVNLRVEEGVTWMLVLDSCLDSTYDGTICWEENNQLVEVLASPVRAR